MDANQRSIKGDFIGFTLGGVHSSELGLVRVSDGSRYNEDLLPPLQDKKAQVAGRDGEIYFDSQYMTKPIKVPVAFDNMNEESFYKLRKLLSNKRPQYLWFDESPYKQWLVKSANAQSFKWVCFDEKRNGQIERIYKGEGTLEFSCFSSCANSRITYLDDMYVPNQENTVYKGYENHEEWEKGSGLRNKEFIFWEKENENEEEKKKTINYETECQVVEGSYSGRGIYVYNAGNIPIKPKIIFEVKDIPEHSDVELILRSSKNLEKPLQTFKLQNKVKSLCNNSDENKIIILDSNLKLTKEAIKKSVGDSYIEEPTGIIYNKFQTGDYLIIPVAEYENESFFIESNIKISIKYTHQYY